MVRPCTPKKISRERREEIVSAYLFLLPSLTGFLLFVFLPLCLVNGISFTKYNVITPAQWNDYKNWIILTKDQRFLMTLGNSVKFVLLLVPMHMVMGLLLAAGVNGIKNRLGVYALRTVYYFPTLLATSSIAMAWTYVLNKDFGIMNYLLSLVGVGPIPWLKSSFWVYPATMLFSLWKFVGGYFLYFFIGLQGIDKTCLEAAEIDGATGWQRFKHITMPLLSPTVFFVFITMLIGTIQIFEEPYMLTNGGPGDASRTISLYIYETAYVSYKYGMASAQSLVLLLIVLGITLVQFKASNMWVNYDRD